jgi:hypothetical protein
MFLWKSLCLTLLGYKIPKAIPHVPVVFLTPNRKSHFREHIHLVFQLKLILETQLKFG